MKCFVKALAIVCVMLMAMTGTVLPYASAETGTRGLNPPPGQRVVQIWIDTIPDWNATLAAYNITPLVEYGDLYVLAYANDEQIAAMRDDEILVGSENRTTIYLMDYVFDTIYGEPNIPQELRIDHYEANTDGLYIVQLIGPAKEEWLDALENMGVVIHHFTHAYSYVVRMNSDIENEIRDTWFVQWVGIYQPAYKFESDITYEKINVHIWNSTTTQETLEVLESLGNVQKSEYYAPDNEYLVIMSVDNSNVDDIARLLDVLVISVSPNPGLFSSNTDWSEIVGDYWWLMVIVIALVVASVAYKVRTARKNSLGGEPGMTDVNKKNESEEHK